MKTRPSPDYSYPPEYRLRCRPDILAVQRGGRRIRTRIATVCLRKNQLGHPRFGFAVSRKVGNAVVRNKIKRRLREVFRHLRPGLDGVDVLVLAKPSMAGSCLELMRQDVEQSLAIWTSGDVGNRRGRRKKGEHRRKTG